MKKLLAIVVLGLLWCNVGFGADIKQITIAGLKIGDSLLNLTSEEVIKESKTPIYKGTKFSTSAFSGSFEDFNEIHVSYETNDKEYKILEIQGIHLVNNIDDCLNRRDNLLKKYSQNLKGTKKKEGQRNHPADKSGKSKMISVVHIFGSAGFLQAVCYDWSNEIGYQDHLNFQVVQKEFLFWKEKNMKY